MKSKNNLKAVIKDGKIVVELEIDDLQQMVINANALANLIPMVITDKDVFAASLVSQFNYEDEAGSTPLHLLFDEIAGLTYEMAEGCDDATEEELAALDEFDHIEGQF